MARARLFCSRRGTAAARGCGDAGDRRCRRARLSGERRGHLPGDRVRAHRGTNAHRLGAGDYSAEDLQPYATAIRELHPPSAATPKPLRGAVAAVGRMLLGSPTFTRRVVLDRWFLRSDGTEFRVLPAPSFERRAPNAERRLGYSLPSPTPTAARPAVAGRAPDRDRANRRAVPVVTVPTCKSLD